MKKKVLSLLLASAMLLSLTACGGSSSSAPAPAPGASGASDAAPAGFKFDRKIDIICPWGVGGGADSTIRPMADLLSKELGVPVQVVNIEGAGGVNGVEYTYKQPADGYTFMLGTQSLIMADLQAIPTMNFKEEFVPVTKLVHSINIIAASKKAAEGKYSNFSELKAYVEKNPNVVSCGMLSATGADAAGLRETLKGMAVKEVPYGSGSEMNAAIAGGHLGLMITGTDEIKGLIASGDIIPLISLSDKRMKLYPDMECTGELGIDSYIGTWRGIFARKGTPQEAQDALVAAVEKCVESETWQNFLKQAVYDEREGYAAPADFQKLVTDEYATFTTYLDGMGVLKRKY